MKKSTRNIKEIIIHCTATPEDRAITVDDIRAWHKARGWSDIGYHYVVYLDGSLHEGRDVDVSGAHCKGHNSTSVGIAYVGGLDGSGNPKDTRTPGQKDTLLNLLGDLRELYPNATIHGHHEFNPSKVCPCFDVKKDYGNI